MKVILVLALILISENVLARENIYLSKDDNYISLAGRYLNRNNAPLEEAVKIFESQKEKTKFLFVADKNLREKFLKWLKISESNVLHVKYLNQSNTESYKVSDLDFVYDINIAGDTHIGGFGFSLKKKDFAIAVLGPNNIFGDGVFKMLDKKDPEHQKVLREHSVTLMPEEEADYAPQVYSGDVLKDGSRLIFILRGDCGSFIQIQKGRSEKWESHCGEWGC